MVGTSPSETDLQARLKRRILGEWIWTSIGLLALSFALTYFSDPLGLKRLEETVYDRFLSVLMDDTPSSDIAIIAIDDSSIAEIGFWPWPRAYHAQLLDYLGSARAVALDLLLSEHNPAYPQDDAVLAESIRNHGRVVLPVMLSPKGDADVHPLPVLKNAAAALGYINIDPDRDGVVRQFQAQRAHSDGRTWHHLAPVLLEQGGYAAQAKKLLSYGSQGLRIAYTGAPGDFFMVPYTRVVDGDIPRSVFDNKFVLIGSWGSGLGDIFATPRSDAGESMSGVEVLANILNSGLNDRWIQVPPRWLAALLALLPVALACASFLYLSPQRAFALTAAIILVTMAASAGLLRYALWWWPPIGALIGLVLAYPVWSWRSQHAALRHIDDELALLHQEQANRAGLDSLRPIQADANPYSATDLDQSLLARIGQLHHAMDQLRLADRQRDETLRFLSHDMRAPLNSILALSELQRTESHDRLNDHTLDQFDHYAHRTLALVDGFVDLSRAAAVALDLQAVNLGELIAFCCEDVWVQAEQKHIKLEYDGLRLDAWIQADRPLLERAWNNLLDNAVKYSAAGTTIRCQITDDDSHWLASIQDEGRGMASDTLANIFSPFVRVHSDTIDNPIGAGLGLAFVHTVVQRHDAHIDVHSKTGQGTRFELRFKKQPAPD